MNVAILTLGTRGDVQPYVALGAALKEAGHEVTIVTGKGFGAMVSGRGLRYAALDLDPLELAQSPEGRTALRSPRGALRLARGLMPTVRKMLVDEWEAATPSSTTRKRWAAATWPRPLGPPASSPSRSRCCRCRIWEGP